MNWKNSDEVFEESCGGWSTKADEATTDDVDRTGGPEEMKSIIRARGCSAAEPAPLRVAEAGCSGAFASPASRRATRSAINLA